MICIWIGECGSQISNIRRWKDRIFVREAVWIDEYMRTTDEHEWTWMKREESTYIYDIRWRNKTGSPHFFDNCHLCNQINSSNLWFRPFYLIP